MAMTASTATRDADEPGVFMPGYEITGRLDAFDALLVILEQTF
jgi:hypothetical protein